MMRLEDRAKDGIFGSYYYKIHLRIFSLGVHLGRIGCRHYLIVLGP
jgi:hypothetical protein